MLSSLNPLIGLRFGFQFKCLDQLFAELRKRLLASSGPSVCLFLWNNSVPTGQIFMKFDIWVFSSNPSRKSKFHYNRTKTTGILHEDQCKSVAYQRIFFGAGFNKFSWGQRAERTGIWGRQPPSQGFRSIYKWVNPVFLLGCYGRIFHGTGNSDHLCQNFGISGGWGFETPKSPLGTPLMHIYYTTSWNSSQNEKCFRQSCRKNQNTHLMFNNSFYRKSCLLWHKVKFTPQQSTKAQRGSRGIALLFP
jgi:hypothetical protein